METESSDTLQGGWPLGYKSDININMLGCGARKVSHSYLPQRQNIPIHLELCFCLSDIFKSGNHTFFNYSLVSKMLEYKIL